MIAAGIAALMTLGSGPSVSDYFPLTPGNKWTYELDSGKRKYVNVQEVLPAVDIKGLKAFPIKLAIDGRTADTAYYDVTPTTISLIGHDPRKPFEAPRPVLKLEDPKSTKWQFEGADEGTPLLMTCEAAVKGTRKVLDQTVEVLELKVDASLGDPNEAFRFKRTAYYGKGIGLIEMTEEMFTGKKLSGKSRLILTKFEPAKPEG